jgi:hypothetical protein
LQKCDVDGSWWRSLDKPKPYAFVFLILLGLFLEFIVHFQLRIAVVYTHFYYLIIIVAGLGYGRKAIHIALLFGAMQLRMLTSRWGSSLLTRSSAPVCS